MDVHIAIELIHKTNISRAKIIPRVSRRGSVDVSFLSSYGGRFSTSVIITRLHLRNKRLNIYGGHSSRARLLPVNLLIRKSCAFCRAPPNHLSMPAAFSWRYVCSVFNRDRNRSYTRRTINGPYTGCLQKIEKFFGGIRFLLRMNIYILNRRSLKLTISDETFYFGMFDNTNCLNVALYVNLMNITYLVKPNEINVVVEYTKIVYCE